MMQPPDADGVYPAAIVEMLPKVTAHERRRLGIMQARAARRKKGSRNRAKALRAVARRQAYFARRRRDAAHKATTRIARQFSLVVVEDLNVKNMTGSARGTREEPGRNVRQKAGLNRAILDVAPSQIRAMLAYKTVWNGGRIAGGARTLYQSGMSCVWVHPRRQSNRPGEFSLHWLRCRSVNRVDLVVRK
jgi:putative transposase